MDALRLQMFIAHYLEGEYSLFKEADACEAMNSILRYIHGAINMIENSNPFLNRTNA